VELISNRIITQQTHWFQFQLKTLFDSLCDWRSWFRAFAIKIPTFFNWQFPAIHSDIAEVNVKAGAGQQSSTDAVFRLNNKCDLVRLLWSVTERN
jgi:hypothetical protein